MIFMIKLILLFKTSLRSIKTKAITTDLDQPAKQTFSMDKIYFPLFHS